MVDPPMLFDRPDEPDPKSRPDEPQAPLVGTPRFQAAVRDQVCFRAASLDQLIPQEHPVRVIWDYALSADLSPLDQSIKAVQRHAGRPPIDPRILFALWLYATTRGVGSARLLEELCRDQIDYPWICGDVSVNYHTLADFRRDHAGLLDDLLTRSVAVLMTEGLVDLERLPELEAKKKPDEKDKARCSTTDPEATVMKMANGGFNPAYNIQFATDTKSQIIVGVDVVTTGSDQGQMPPMVGQIQQRYGRAPTEYEVDGGFATHEDIEAVSAPEIGCTVYAPVPKLRDPKVDRHAPHSGDGAAVAEWRRRMGTAEAKEIYQDRAATAECVNALARRRGLVQLVVRGLAKVRVVALWMALAHKVRRMAALRAAAASG
jgi:transposase